MTTNDAALCWRVERACAAAWPARDRGMVGGWSVHRSGGGSRRTNSASPAAAGALLDADTLDAIGAAYASAGQPAIVRLTDLWRGDTGVLDRAGFLPGEAPTRTLLRRPQRSEGIRSAVLLSATPEHEWLATRRRLSPSDAADHHLVPTRVTAPAAFARRVEGGCDVAIGYAALSGDVAVLEAIGTDPAARGRGHARAIVAALVDWAARAGAAHVALQVERSNAPARSLYARCGFSTDLYSYHYRRSPPCPTSG